MSLEVLFTKLFADRPPTAVVETAARLGFDGIDLLIRSGGTVSPRDTHQIARAVDTFGVAGLTVPMATCDITDPDVGAADTLFGACADAGIGLLRLGYWTYDGSRRYAEVRQEADRHLDRLVDLAGTHGIRLALQLHGGTIHSSGALAADLLAGRDPALIGAYPDPGNQTVQDGREDWRLTFDLLEPWLACVGVKNGGWFRTGGSRTSDPEPSVPTPATWESSWLGVSDGMVPWPAILGHLLARGFNGPLSFHSHYPWGFDDVIAQTAADLRYVRAVIQNAADATNVATRNTESSERGGGV